MIGDEYLQTAIRVALQNKSLQDSAEQEMLANEQQLKRDSMLEKAAKLASNKVNGKGNFATDQTFEDICNQNGFDPEEIINKVNEEQFQNMGNFGIDTYLGGL